MSKRIDAWLKEHGSGESLLQTLLVGYFGLQRESIVAQLRAMQGTPGTAATLADQVFRPREWDEQLRNTVRQPLRDIAYGAASREWDEGQKSPDYSAKKLLEPPPEVKSDIDAEIETILARPYWPEINDTTRNLLVSAFEEGIAAGESLYELAMRVEDVLDQGQNTIRGLLIARTETTGALNAGHQAAQKRLAQLGVLAKKEWFAVVDIHTRDTHIDAHGQQVAVNDNFQVGSESAPYPGHYGLSGKERCHCRCTSLSVYE
jgi:uncharacterized protein with gpF-like domain